MPYQELLYVKVVNITEEYLGPAAERFITRQVINHLQITPSELAKDDLKDLIDWISLAMGFMTNDEPMINEYVNRLKELTPHKPTKPAAR